MTDTREHPVDASPEELNTPIHRRPGAGRPPFSLELVESALSKRGEKPSLSLREIADAIEPRIPLSRNDREFRRRDQAAYARKRIGKAKVAAFRGLRYLRDLGRLEPLGKGEYRLAGGSFAGGSLAIANRAAGELLEKASELFELLSTWEKDKPSPFLEPDRRAELARVRPVSLAEDRVRAIELMCEVLWLIPAVAASMATRVSDAAFADLPSLLLSGDTQELGTMLEAAASGAADTLAKAEATAKLSKAPKADLDQLHYLGLKAQGLTFGDFFLIREQLGILHEIAARSSNAETEHAFEAWGEGLVESGYEDVGGRWVARYESSAREPADIRSGGISMRKRRHGSAREPAPKSVPPSRSGHHVGRRRADRSRARKS